jgi:hypothetical protein
MRFGRPPFLVWFAIGDLSFRGRAVDDYVYGPYDVGPESGYFVGASAAVVALAALAVLVILTRQEMVDRRAWAVVTTLATAGALGAAGWRTATAGVGGANIGAGFAVLFVPPLIAGLLVVAVWLVGGAGRWRPRWTWLLTLAAVLVAPALNAGLGALSAYDADGGLITARQYADVRIGETQSSTRKRLGREGADTYWFFPPVTSGLRCDYYLDVSRATSPDAPVYQFCFRAGALVSKNLSADPLG